MSVHDLELATDGETIAAAWIGERLLSFARFDNQLEPLGTNATNPIFVQRSDGWPLLIYEHTDFAAAFSTEVVAEQLEDDGAAAWQTSLGTAFWQDQTSAAASGDGTLVAARSTEGTEDTLVIPLAADGTIGAGQVVDDAYGLELAPTTDGVALVWRGADGWVWGRFDGAGGRSIAAVTQSQRTELEAVHIADDGRTTVDVYTVAIESTELNEIEGIAFGDDVVLGWISYSPHPSRAPFVLARLDP